MIASESAFPQRADDVENGKLDSRRVMESLGIALVQASILPCLSRLATGASWRFGLLRLVEDGNSRADMYVVVSVLEF